MAENFQSTWTDNQMRRAYEQGTLDNLQRVINSGAIPGLGSSIGPDALNYYDQKLLGPLVPVVGTTALVNTEDGRVVNRQTGDQMGKATELTGQAAETVRPLVAVPSIGGVANIIDGAFYNQNGQKIGTVTPLSTTQGAQAVADSVPSGASSGGISAPADAAVTSPTTDSGKTDGSSTPSGGSTTDNSNPTPTPKPNPKPRPDINDGGNPNNGGGGCNMGGMISRLFSGLGGMSMLAPLAMMGLMGGRMGGMGMAMMLPMMFMNLLRMGGRF